ncbi:MAG: 3-isopropylmalate dehydratase small subunit [Proteobacteria bacterium]|nr:3-isopropylmalate dehydratase small subunit [Pseudomonadota bacterium]MDA1063604.1 3-isopropylmalate dehydratase small subunit [Pseudomonadota bacterium]
MQPITRIRSTTVVLPTRDIDTDQIIPARFLTATSREGFGVQLFHDLRFNKDGSPNPGFALNQPAAAGCAVLVAGNNFGCGSSREHAIWALLDYGIRAVVSTEIADIFRNNGLKNGLISIVVDTQTHQWLLDNPGTEVEIDIARTTLRFAGDKTVAFQLDDFARYCLVGGIDQLGFLRQRMPDIENFEQNRSWTP